MTKFAYYIKIRNLPYFIEEIQRVCWECPKYTRLKPRFYSSTSTHLIKTTKSIKRFGIDFKGSFPSAFWKRFLLTIVDEYSQFSFVLAYPELTPPTVIKCLNLIFTSFQTVNPYFNQREYLTYLGIANSHATPFNPRKIKINE